MKLFKIEFQGAHRIGVRRGLAFVYAPDAEAAKYTVVAGLRDMYAEQYNGGKEVVAAVAQVFDNVSVTELPLVDAALVYLDDGAE